MNIADSKYLLFVGSGRTGSTLVGQLLNRHPEVVVSNELRVLQYCVVNGLPINEKLAEIVEKADESFLSVGRRQVNPLAMIRAYRWHRDWNGGRRFRSAESLKKSSVIKYIGDKKQGGNSRLIIENEEKVYQALREIQWLPISVLRDPQQIVASSARLGFVSDTDIVRGMTDFRVGIELVRKHAGILVDYNKLINYPTECARQLCKQLAIDDDENWLAFVNAIVNKKKSPRVKLKVSGRNAELIEEMRQLWVEVIDQI